MLKEQRFKIAHMLLNTKGQGSGNGTRTVWNNPTGGALGMELHYS